MTKIFATEFKLNSKILSIIYLCYKYEFPISIMLSFYEMYEDNALFVFKTLSCAKKSKINDNILINVLNESRILLKQIQQGITSLEKNEEPKLNLADFSNEYRIFIQDYLLKNIENIYEPIIKFKFNTSDLYKEVV